MLGPTNTGKTHRAVERMLEHATGMIGLPLRLLAREIYDRVSARCGETAVALVTGEERRVPSNPRYWVCTVEAMPSIDVDFLAVDEIQLAAHPERGHVFTERLLGWRGVKETWFLGSDTIRNVLERLVPTAQVQRAARLSTLRSAGASPLGQLPPRTAVVAFSAARVYELAERIKLKRGGAAVVLGALSPRARNAQVAMYQAGEVDFLVATDAIGMGLNMNVDCVAFADVKKYDGRQSRLLEDAELAQIAGRAGRNRNDGRFCALAPQPPLPFATIKAIEDHRFASISRIYWRNDELDFSSAEALLRALGRRPFANCLQLADHAEDQQALVRLMKRRDVQALATSASRVQLLWQVCQVPDFRRLLLDDHFELLASIFLQLSQLGQLQIDWVNKQVKRLDDVSGELDMLLMRMAAIRTWTFITHRTAWIADAHNWQERTLAIEDRLSEALHDQLVSRFVDRHGRRRGSTSTRQRDDKLTPLPPTGAKLTRARSLAELAALLPKHEPASQKQIDAWANAPHDRFELRAEGKIVDREAPEAGPLARLTAGAEVLRPELVILAADSGGGALQVRRRLQAFVRDLVKQHLGQLEAPPPPEASPALRGLLYGLRQGLGTLRAAESADLWEQLDEQDWAYLRSLGFVGNSSLSFLRSTLQPPVLALRWALLSPLWKDRPVQPGAEQKVVKLVADQDAPLWLAAGYPCWQGRAVRADFLLHVTRGIAAGAPAVQVCRWLRCSPAQARSAIDEVRATAGDFINGPPDQRPRHERHRPAPRKDA
jgi:ATP-dependent RNA helicase SUPV3L1/SUV3